MDLKQIEGVLNPQNTEANHQTPHLRVDHFEVAEGQKGCKFWNKFKKKSSRPKLNENWDTNFFEPFITFLKPETQNPHSIKFTSSLRLLRF